MNNRSKTAKISRRRFLKKTAKAAALSFPLFVPAQVLGKNSTPPSEKVAVAFIGIGGKGRNGMRNFLACKQTRPVAVCDVDKRLWKRSLDICSLTEKDAYTDFRKLLERKDIEAVQVATPDHWHVLIAKAAVQAGKDVYCEKPLCNTIAEGQALVKTVNRYGAVFQHGTQLRSLPAVRQACQLVRNGRIGKLKHVIIGSPAGKAERLFAPEPVPAELDYNMWLGPAPYSPYCKRRVENKGGDTGWYFISDYSKSGWVAGYGVHDIDIANWGMGTEYTGPVEIHGTCKYPEQGLFDTPTNYHLHFKYANGVTVEMMNTDKARHGVKFIGSDGWVYCRSTIEAQPADLIHERFSSGDTLLYKSDLHEQNFLDCVKSRKKTITPIEVAHRATSTALLGGIALKLARKLEWNPDKERFVNDPQADKLLSCPMRNPWRL
jgi:predicted dehydrogenase